MFDQAYKDFGIGFALKCVSVVDKKFFEDGIILNGAVMDHCNIAGVTDMRMCVCVVRLSVGSPAGVGNSDRSAYVSR